MVSKKQEKKAKESEKKDSKAEEIKDEKKKEGEKEEAPPLPKSVQLLQELRDNIRSLEKAVLKRDDRVPAALSRHNRKVREGVSVPILQSIVDEFVPLKSDRLRKTLTSLLNDVKNRAMDDKSDAEEISSFLQTAKMLPRTAAPTPEVEVYICLLISVFLIDNDLHEKSLALLETSVNRVMQLNRRSLDRFSAKVFFFITLCYEKLGKLSEFRPKLISLHRSACLRHDEPGQTVLSNCILRSFLADRLYVQAEKFRLNSVFPEGRSNYQSARYLYYLGKISCVQLHYTDAFEHLSHSLRKAPSQAAVGFRQTATKLLVITQLLMGDIPERSLFLEPKLRRSLKPYFQLTQAVRVGDLAGFSRIQKEHAVVFERDDVANLITRLRFNVIKTGLRKMSVSYSRISIADIASKLSISSLEDAEYIVSKAIRDGVIDAVIDREKKFVFSNDTVDVYSSNEPQAAFYRRIKFCFEIHNESVKSMRFPDKDKEGADDKDDLEHDHDDLLEQLEEELKEEDLDDLDRKSVV